MPVGLAGGDSLTERRALLAGLRDLELGLREGGSASSTSLKAALVELETALRARSTARTAAPSVGTGDEVSSGAAAGQPPILADERSTATEALAQNAGHGPGGANAQDAALTETRTDDDADAYDRLAHSRHLDVKLERLIEDASGLLEELRRITLFSNQANVEILGKSPSREDAQAILREIADVRAVHEKTAKRMESAFCAIQASLDQIARLCNQLRGLAREMMPEGRSPAADAFDPFGPILTHLKQSCEPAALVKGWTGAKAALAPDQPRASKNEGERADWPGTRGSAEVAANFLIEPGLGLPPLGEAHPQSHARSRACDEAASRTEAATDTGQAAHKANEEPGSAMAQPPAEGGSARRDRSPRREGDGLSFARHRLPLALGSAILAAAVAAYALDRTLIRAHFADLFSGFVSQWQGSVGRAKPEAARQARAQSALRVRPATGLAGQLRPEQAWADKATGAAGPASAATLDPLAPAQSQLYAEGSRRGPAPRVIAGSDSILAGTLQPAAAAPAAGLQRAGDAPQGPTTPEIASSRPAQPQRSAGPGKNPGGLEDLAARAEAGDAAAQFDLAARYAEGAGDAQNYALAAHWFGKAAQQGHALAQHRLASLYERGLGVEKDIERAKDLYRRAAEKGSVRAMHNLGVLAAEGNDGKPNYASAALWFGKAAEYGVRDSQYNLAVLLARGLGVPKDLVKAYTWFLIVAAAGDPEAAAKRDEIKTRLTASELAAANAAAASFVPRPVDSAVSENAPAESKRQGAPEQGAPVRSQLSGL